MPSQTDARFNWRDPLLLEQQLTRDERMVRDSACAYCHENLAPRVLEAFRSEGGDAAVIYRELGELDMLAVTIPEQYGGAGLGYVSYGLVAREIERVDSGYRSMMSVQGSLVITPINEFGTAAQKQKFIADSEEAGRHADRDRTPPPGMPPPRTDEDDGIAAPEITSMLKRNSAGKALDIARVARDMLGGNGVVDEFGVIRHLVNLEVVNTYEGAHDVHALILGRAQTGIAAFSN